MASRSFYLMTVALYWGVSTGIYDKLYPDTKEKTILSLSFPP